MSKDFFNVWVCFELSLLAFTHHNNYHFVNSLFVIHFKKHLWKLSPNNLAINIFALHIDYSLTISVLNLLIWKLLTIRYIAPPFKIVEHNYWEGGGCSLTVMCYLSYNFCTENESSAIYASKSNDYQRWGVRFRQS